jgi:hypothetical protein
MDAVDMMRTIQIFGKEDRLHIANHIALDARRTEERLSLLRQIP